MSDNPSTVTIGNTGIMNVPDVGVFSYYNGSGGNDEMWNTIILDDRSVQWEADPELVQGKRIVPYGVNNRLPVVVRKMMEENNLAPAILEREMGLLHGQGPQLYVDVFENGVITRKWEDDQQVWNWLKSWNYRRFLDMATVEYKYLNGVFVKRFMRKGARIGRNPEFVLDACSGTDARLGWVDSRRLEDVDTIYTGDFENNCFRTGIRAWPVFDRNDPFGKPACMSYHNSYSFAHHFYSTPSFWGTRKWIARSSDIPDVLKYLSDNSLALTHHIHSPAGYWAEKRDKLEARFPSKQETEIDKLLAELKEETFKTISEVLAGKKNTGKFIETVDFYDEEAGEIVSWKIEQVPTNNDKFVKSQIEISHEAQSAITSGIGLNAALSNIMIGGKGSSGSEMLYALKLYLASDVAIAEEVIFEAINQCIEIMWPEKKCRLGFYHQVVMKEENVTPSDRVTKTI